MEGEGQQINQDLPQAPAPIEQTPPAAGQGYVAPQRSFVEALTARSVVNVTSWLLLFLLAPATILVLISQNTVPGDFFYPVKRGLEDGVLVAASVHPTTKAIFRTDLANRRFSEAETLLLASANTAGLSEFITEIQATQDAIAQVSDPVQKQQLEKKLQNAYEEYEKRLIAVRVQLEAQEQAPPTAPEVQPQPTSTPPPTGGPTSPPGELPRPTNTPVPVPTSPPGQPLRPTNTPVPLPTSAPHVPSPTYALPSPTPTPQVLPPTPTDKIDQTIDYLTCLKTRRPSECTPPARTRSVHEEREERREVREERREEQREEKRDRKEEREERREKENRREKSP